MLEHLDTLAKTAATAISNVKFDKVVVWDGGSANGVGGTAGFLQNMGRTLPPMMQVLRDIAGVELPGYLGTMSADGDSRPVPDPGVSPVAPMNEQRAKA
jgi:flotillin